MAQKNLAGLKSRCPAGLLTVAVYGMSWCVTSHGLKGFLTQGRKDVRGKAATKRT